jgi:hypothetical protein
MNKTIRNGIISSFLILVLSLSFLILILSLGSNAPSRWGFVGAHERSIFVFHVFTYAIIVSLLALPFWTFAIFSFYTIFNNKKLGKVILSVTIISVICLIAVYIVELVIVRSNIISSNIDTSMYKHLEKLDNLMFYFDNIGYFMYGLSSILVLKIIDANLRGTIQVISLLFFGITSMAGLPGVLLDNKILMIINLTGMAISYPMAAGSFLSVFMKLRNITGSDHGA